MTAARCVECAAILEPEETWPSAQGALCREHFVANVERLAFDEEESDLIAALAVMSNPLPRPDERYQVNSAAEVLALFASDPVAAPTLPDPPSGTKWMACPLCERTALVAGRNRPCALTQGCEGILNPSVAKRAAA